MVVGKIVGEIVRRTGAGLIPKFAQAFNRYDVKLHTGLFGKAGGKGFRHGRDAGLAISSQISAFRGDDLGGTPYQPGYPPRKFVKTRNRYGNKRRSRRDNECYYPSRSRRRPARF